MKKFAPAIVFGLAIVISSLVLGYAFINRNSSEGHISVTGLGNADFTSDLIVWEGSFSRESMDLKQAYQQLEADKQTITTYLIEKGIAEEELVFKAVTTRKNTKPRYTEEGKYAGEEFIGFQLSQSLQIDSKDVDMIEKISREVTELLNKGIQFYSQPPRYYYTKLADLKIEMISKATQDAYARAQKIADNSGAELGKLVTANMGVFQITGQNSNEDYSWGGTYNTSSKHKTASITMKLDYQVN
ncbi:SIMPL domain-containing protein [Psychroflexus tropicus]|uniref:SIMPL domain-containing protein n=1 Tax=Psychroflexus tropicus TaxID=197345 RepID=UPI0003713C6E|nr:SIMPL domain-containing protein [Psychroflexus tropicus]